MGMSTEEFERQKVDTSKRFYIDHTREHTQTGRYDDDYSWCVVDRSTGEVVGYDGGEPEDQILVRNWSWVVDALNKVNDEKQK